MVCVCMYLYMKKYMKDADRDILGSCHKVMDLEMILLLF